MIDKCKIYIVSGPSGVGKNTVLRMLCEKIEGAQFIVPFTTRKRRVDEKESIDYDFISREEFGTLYNNRELLEWDYVLDNYYGFSNFRFSFSSTLSFTHALAKMALRIKEKNPDIVTTIFLKPDNNDVIEKRLLDREFNNNSVEQNTDDRVKHGKDEQVHAKLFDFVVESSCKDVAVNRILSIIDKTSL